MKAIELIDTLRVGDAIRIVLGDPESLENVARDLKTRGLKTVFNEEGKNRFVLTITK